MNKVLRQEEVPLSTMRVGALSQVVRMDGPEADINRLKAMGVCGGRTIQLLQAGNPLIVKVYGTRVGVSGRLADHVVVTPWQDECEPGTSDVR